MPVFQNVEICDDEMGKMVEEVMKNYDVNKDGTIEFNEMKTLLGVEDNVLTHLEVDKNLTIPQFNMIFDYYDVDSEFTTHVLYLHVTLARQISLLST